MRKLDFHCHIYPAKIAEKARHSTGDFYGVTCGDCLGTAEDLLMRCDGAGIETCVVHSVATKPEQVDRINDFLAAVSAGHPGRLIPFGTVHQDTPDMEEVVDGLYARGFLGVKLHPDIQKVALNDPRLMRLFAACRGKLMVLFHAGDDRYSYSNPAEIIPVLEAFPDVTFIGAHLCGYRVWAEAAENLARRYDNLYVDCSSTSFAREQGRGRPGPARAGAGGRLLEQRGEAAASEIRNTGCAESPHSRYYFACILSEV